MSDEDENAVDRMRFRGRRGGASAARNRWLPEGRRGPMPWIIAIMMFLTLLAAAAGLGLGYALVQMRSQLAGGYTVQIVEANPAARARQVGKVIAFLKRQDEVKDISAVPEEQLRAQLEPWIGVDVHEDELPIPALIDIEVRAPTAPAAIDSLREGLGAIAPSARMESHGNYLAPVERLMRGLMWLSAGLVALMMVMTGAVATMAARSAHATHRSTIDIMHLLGATDIQVARLFQRRMTLDAMFGAVVGSLAAVTALLLLARGLADMGSELTAMIVLPWRLALVLLGVPVFAVLVAAVAARITVTRALERSL